jgi:hypothetical protein
MTKLLTHRLIIKIMRVPSYTFKSNNFNKIKVMLIAYLS